MIFFIFFLVPVYLFIPFLSSSFFQLLRYLFIFISHFLGYFNFLFYHLLSNPLHLLSNHLQLLPRPCLLLYSLPFIILFLSFTYHHFLLHHFLFHHLFSTIFLIFFFHVPFLLLSSFLSLHHRSGLLR